MVRKSPNREKVILLLWGGLALSLKRTPKGYFKLLGGIAKEWKAIDQRALTQTIRDLYKSKLILQKKNKDGTTTFILSKDGKREALTYSLTRMEIVKHKWDSIWRLVIFDIPEKKKKVRDAIRYHLKRLGFVELQRSVFVLPFKCKKEMEFLIEFYNVRRYIRYIEANHIDNELHLKSKFKLK